jgi:ParB/Sulfiredoxin domain
MFHVKHAPEFSQLVESIREYGAFLPVYYFEGEVLDGSRRARACLEAGRTFTRVFLPTVEAAAKVLYTLHPERAHRRFAASLPLLDAARLLGASPSAVVHLRKKPKQKKRYATPKGLKLRALLDERTSRHWQQLLSEHRCKVNEAIAALIWSTSGNQSASESFVYELKKARAR